MRAIAPWAILICVAWCIAVTPLLARADTASTPESALLGRGALAAVDQVLSARPGRAFIQAAGSAGYGFTESQAGEGAHHRMEASVAAAIRPIQPLAISLSFDGRYDAHPGGDDGAVGLPRITVVGSQPLATRLHVGAALSLALPGQTAPSIDFGAAVVSVLALGSLRVSGGWQLSAQLGFRIDNSAEAAPDLARLSRADRLSLGLSDAHAVPLGVAATKTLEDWQLSAELSGEILVGSAAPGFLESPLRAALVARLPVARDLSIELFSRLSLSQRPDYARVQPLIPVEPRLMIGVGLRFATQPKVEVAAPTRTDLYGTTHDAEGKPVPNALVVVRVSGLAVAQRTLPDGTFHFENLPRGAARLQVTADELDPLEHALMLDRAQQTIAVELTPHAAGSQLRGLVRSFDGAPLAAQVRLLPEGTSVSADNDGRFVLELAPGSYQVEIECTGYRTQRRNVTVQKNGVTLLNVELRALRH
jgi:hypothetical protein